MERNLQTVMKPYMTTKIETDATSIKHIMKTTRENMMETQMETNTKTIMKTAMKTRMETVLELGM